MCPYWQSSQQRLVHMGLEYIFRGVFTPLKSIIHVYTEEKITLIFKCFYLALSFLGKSMQRN